MLCLGALNTVENNLYCKIISYIGSFYAVVIKKYFKIDFVYVNYILIRLDNIIILCQGTILKFSLLFYF